MEIKFVYKRCIKLEKLWSKENVNSLKSQQEIMVKPLPTITVIYSEECILFYDFNCK